MTPAVSVVIPVYNEAENLPLLIQQLQAALRSLDGRCEVIVVDDGSTDSSGELLPRLVMEGPLPITVVRLGRRFGQSAALAAGFDHAAGGVVVTLDGDLQNDPADIPRVLAKLQEGFDVVSGWRRERRGSWVARQLPSRLANWLIRATFGVPVHDVGCTLKAYRREVLRHIGLTGEMHRFLPVLAAWGGAKVAEIPVNDRARVRGQSKYNLSRTFKVLLDLLTLKCLLAFGSRPSYIFGGIGLMLLGLGGVLGILIAIRACFYTGVWMSPGIFVMAIALICGVQCLLMGILAEFVVRVYHQLLEHPVYEVRGVLRPTTKER